MGETVDPALGVLAAEISALRESEATARALVRRLAAGWKRYYDHVGLRGWLWCRGDSEKEMTPAEAALYAEWTAE